MNEDSHMRGRDMKDGRFRSRDDDDWPGRKRHRPDYRPDTEPPSKRSGRGFNGGRDFRSPSGSKSSRSGPRLHRNTIMLRNLYILPAGAGSHAFKNLSKDELQNRFDDFFADVFVECEDKYGAIRDMNVCDSSKDDFLGDVIIKFQRDEDAERAVRDMRNRSFKGRLIDAELTPDINIEERSCRFYKLGKCERGTNCKFMHVMGISSNLECFLHERARNKASGLPQLPMEEEIRPRFDAPGGGPVEWEPRSIQFRGRSVTPSGRLSPEADGSARRLISWNVKSKPIEDISDNGLKTVLLQNLYTLPKKAEKSADGTFLVTDLSEEELQAHFDDFFQDVYRECEDTYGEIREMNVCDNLQDHIFGNVIIKFLRAEDADKAVCDMNNRSFKGRQVKAKLTPDVDSRKSSCHQYELGKCHRLASCKFLHLKPISRELEQLLRYRRRKDDWQEHEVPLNPLQRPGEDPSFQNEMTMPHTDFGCPGGPGHFSDKLPHNRGDGDFMGHNGSVQLPSGEVNPNDTSGPRTVILLNMYQSPQMLANGPPLDVPPEQMQRHFEEFFQEVFVECENKYGEIEELNVCDNAQENLLGSVIIRYHRREDAERAVFHLNNRSFKGRRVRAKLSPDIDTLNTSCKEYEVGVCPRGASCPQLHLKLISCELGEFLRTRARRKQENQMMQNEFGPPRGFQGPNFPINDMQGRNAFGRKPFTQEFPPPSLAKWKIASLKINGCKEASERDTIDEVLNSQEIEIACLQSTEMATGTADTKSYTWHFSGDSESSAEGGAGESESSAEGGVAILVQQRMTHIIHKVSQISGRVMGLEVESKNHRVMVITAHIPPPPSPLCEETFASLSSLLEELSEKKMPILLLGCFNAKIGSTDLAIKERSLIGHNLSDEVCDSNGTSFKDICVKFRLKAFTTCSKKSVRATGKVGEEFRQTDHMLGSISSFLMYDIQGKWFREITLDHKFLSATAALKVPKEGSRNN